MGHFNETVIGVFKTTFRWRKKKSGYLKMLQIKQTKKDVVDNELNRKNWSNIGSTLIVEMFSTALREPLSLEED